MLSSIMNVIALLSLTGIGVYSVVSTPLLRDRLYLRRMLVGLVVGLVTALMGHLSLPPESVSYLAAVAGPLLLAGFVGSYPGGLAAGLLSALPFAMQDNFAVTLGQHMTVAMLGAGISHILFQWRCVQFSVKVFGLLLATAALYITVQTVFFPYNPPKPLLTSVAFAVLSTAIAYGMTAMAIRSARNLRALAKFEARMRMASEVAQIGTWDWDVTNDECTWDEGMYRLYGRGAEGGKIRPSEFIELVHPDDRLRLQTSYEAASLGGAPQHDEFRAYTSDGSLRTIHSALKNQFDSSGRLVRISGLHMDVTNLRLAEAERGAAETRLRDVIANVPGGLLTYRLDPDGTHSAQFLNPFCHELLELSPATVAEDGRGLFRQVRSDDRPALLQTLKRAIRQKTPFEHRWRMTLPSGKEIWLEGRGIPRTLPNGGVEFSAFLIDITDLVRAQQALALEKDRTARTERLETIGKLSGGVAHDFNNLLAIIVGNLEMLREDLSGDDQKQGFVRAGLEASLRGADLVRNMLTFAQKARLEPKSYPVPDLFERVDSWVMRVLPATVRVKVDLPDDVHPMHVDAAGAENALVNLILNARDAMPDGGDVTISARNCTISAQSAANARAPDLQPGSYVAITVHDTGHGIPADVAERVFEPFFSTRGSGHTSGSGLGLATVRGFVQQSGGSIDVASTPGMGTQVTLYVPAAKGDARHCAETRPPPREATPAAGQRILLAEDEMQVAEVLKRSLEKDGYRVSLAHSGDSAVDVFQREGPFDILVSDIVMPGQLQGPDLAARLRQDVPSLPAVFLSGYAPDTVFKSSGIRPTDPRLMKPVTRAELSAAVQSALSKSASRTAAE